jgi:tetraacyldisaccharide 4'-kinase
MSRLAMGSEDVGFVEALWYGSGGGVAAVRELLWPASRAYEMAIAVRAKLYEAGVLKSEAPALATVSVGNLTVGGTGKTPFAAWLASQLARSARPAIVLRGYGGGQDEVEVHRRLNPNVPVVANPDRAAAIREARTRGADVAILDDAFQHRRIRRTADIVLLSAEQLVRPIRQLPTGPWREPLHAAKRAHLIVVTRKSATSADAERALAMLDAIAPGVPTAVVHLAPRQLVDAARNTTLPLDKLRGAQVVAIAAIGEPSLFARQLESLGARVSLVAFRDHHAYSNADITAAAARVPRDGLAICTLKDAVKLAPRWPGPSRLWYVSQQLVVEKGADDMDRLLKRVLDARASTAITAG